MALRGKKMALRGKKMALRGKKMAFRGKKCYLSTFLYLLFNNTVFFITVRAPFLSVIKNT